MRVRSVLKHLGDAKTNIMKSFKTGGGDLDRWHTRDQRLMVEAIIRAEDHLENEMRGRMTSSREELRVVRRELESYCFTD